jgi:uncharacterized membrane protein YhhN
VTGTAFLLLALTIVAAAADWHAVFHGSKPLEYVCKPLTMAMLFAATLALDVDHPAVRAWFLVAVALCLLGDVLLMLPQDLFVFGLAAFLLGHLAYIVGMHVDGIDGQRFSIGVGLAVVAVAVIGTPILRAVRAGPEPELAAPVLAYMAVISTMVASAIGAGHLAGVVGAAAFYSSDALIAWNRFLRTTRHAGLAIMVTYHLGQVGLVLSLLS